jgi:hypothetical protein
MHVRVPPERAAQAQVTAAAADRQGSATGGGVPLSTNDSCHTSTSLTLVKIIALGVLLLKPDRKHSGSAFTEATQVTFSSWHQSSRSITAIKQTPTKARPE